MKNKIYNLQHGVVEVYQFEPLHEELSLLRMQELNKLPESQQLLKRRDTKSWFTPKKGVVYTCDNYILQELNLHDSRDYETFRYLRSSYILGEYAHDPIHTYPAFYALMPYDGTMYYYVQLTEDAYHAYLLENEQFELLDDYNLDTFKGMFHISSEPISTLSLNELQRTFDSGIILESFPEKIDYLERSSKVYQKIKR